MYEVFCMYGSFAQNDSLLKPKLRPSYMCRSNYSPTGRVGDFPPAQWQLSQSYSQLSASRRRIGGAVLDAVTLPSLEDKTGIISYFSVLLRNVRPVGHQVSRYIFADFSHDNYR
jgi:hypothetical protein